MIVCVVHDAKIYMATTHMTIVFVKGTLCVVIKDALVNNSHNQLSFICLSILFSSWSVCILKWFSTACTYSTTKAYKQNGIPAGGIS